MSYLVRLKANWPGNFRRSVRRDTESGEQVLHGGEITHVMEFTPGEVAELNEEEFRAISADIGVCIEHVNIDGNGRPRTSEDPVEVDDSVGNSDRWLDVPHNVLTSLAKAGIQSRETLDVYMADNELTDLIGIGESSATAIREALHEPE